MEASMPTTAVPTIADLPRALEERDAATQATLFADDAVLTTIDAQHGPSDPLVQRGRAEIAAALVDICARDMTHQVTHFLHQGDRASVGVACRYPDGVRVQCLAEMKLRDGKIVEQTTVQAWDS
jgi:ketosteroid isomerase-like protein